MKIAVAITMVLGSVLGTVGAEPREIPPEPPIEEIEKKARVAAIVLTCEPTKEQKGLKVVEVLKGESIYVANREMITKLIPASDPKALATKGFRELVFIGPATAEGKFVSATTLALWPARHDSDGIQQFKFLAHDYSEVKRAVQTEKE